MKNFANDLPYTKSTRMNNMNQPPNIKRLTRTHKNTRYNPRFGNHHKGVLLLVEEPTKGRVFSNPNPPQADHKGQGNLFSNQLKERVIQTSWGRPQIWRLPSNLKRSWNLGFQEHQESTRGVCTSSSLCKRDGRGKPNREHKHKPHTQELLQQGWILRKI